MRFELPADMALVFEMTLPIRWGDMDAMGHVNNTLYLRYMEVIRIDWLQQLGAAPDPQGQGPVIVNAFCNFIRQLTYPGDIRVRQYACPPGRSSIDTYCRIERVDQPGVVYAEGGATVVWTDFPAGRSAPLPQALRARLPAPAPSGD